MKIRVEVADKDVVLLLGIAKGNGFKRAKPLAPYSELEKEQAISFLMTSFIEQMKQKVIEIGARKMAEKDAESKKDFGNLAKNLQQRFAEADALDALDLIKKKKKSNGNNARVGNKE